MVSESPHSIPADWKRFNILKDANNNDRPVPNERPVPVITEQKSNRMEGNLTMKISILLVASILLSPYVVKADTLDEPEMCNQATAPAYCREVAYDDLPAGIRVTMKSLN